MAAISGRDPTFSSTASGTPILESCIGLRLVVTRASQQGHGASLVLLLSRLKLSTIVTGRLAGLDPGLSLTLALLSPVLCIAYHGRLSHYSVTHHIRQTARYSPNNKHHQQNTITDRLYALLCFFSISFDLATSERKELLGEMRKSVYS